MRNVSTSQPSVCTSARSRSCQCTACIGCSTRCVGATLSPPYEIIGISDMLMPHSLLKSRVVEVCLVLLCFFACSLVVLLVYRLTPR